MMLSLLVMALMTVECQQIFNRSVPRIAELTITTNNSAEEEAAEHHLDFTKNMPPFQVSASLRGLGSKGSKDQRPPVLDDLSDFEDLDTPDIWDILIWIGAWIGRATRAVIVGLVKLGYALYTGMRYGWESAAELDD